MNLLICVTAEAAAVPAETLNVRRFGPKPMDYEFVTIWRIAAPIDEVCEAISHSHHWPKWWRGVE
jgi:hypothetical protein